MSRNGTFGASHHDMWGTDLDDVLEGFAVAPDEHVADPLSESTASVRMATVLDTGADRHPTGGGFVEKLEASADGRPRARLRYVGQPRRGVQPYAQLDDQDHREALRCIEEGMRGLAYYRSAAMRAMPKAQRDDIRLAAVECLRRAQRWLEEIAERNTLKPRKP